jgi:hypothetical protein
MVIALVQLFVDQLFDIRIMKQALPIESFLAEMVQHTFFEIAGQPLCERHAESSFLPVDNVAG